MCVAWFVFEVVIAGVNVTSNTITQVRVVDEFVSMYVIDVEGRLNGIQASLAVKWNVLKIVRVGKSQGFLRHVVLLQLLLLLLLIRQINVCLFGIF